MGYDLGKLYRELEKKEQPQKHFTTLHKEEQNYICQNRLPTGKAQEKLIMPWSTRLDYRNSQVAIKPLGLGSEHCHRNTN